MFHFHLSNIVSIVSISAEKLMDLEGLHFNILIQVLHLACLIISLYLQHHFDSFENFFNENLNSIRQSLLGILLRIR